MKRFHLKLLFYFLLKHTFVCGSSEYYDSLSDEIYENNRFVEKDEVNLKIIEDAEATRLHDSILGQDCYITDIEKFKAGSNNEDIHLSITQLIHKYGYKVEVHQVRTEDGYVLTLHRIPGHGKVVFLMHGVMGSSDDYVTPGPGNAIAYFLASEGYDVWMGNARGNKHSRRHEHLSPRLAVFWEFSWDEIGRRDLPAMIDYVLASTGETKLNYIGWSQGTTAAFVLCSELPEYNQKISVLIALAPVAWMSHLKSPIPRVMAPQSRIISRTLKSLGIYEMLPDNLIVRGMRDLVCGVGGNPLDRILCRNILFLFIGNKGERFNVTNLPVILSHVPSGASVRQIEHYGQEIVSGKFCQFDYGRDNIKIYGRPVPPDYPVEKITAPTALFYSDADWFSNDTDVLILRRKLPNVAEFHLIENYSHFDFVWASDIKQLLVPRLLRLIKQFS